MSGLCWWLVVGGCWLYHSFWWGLIFYRSVRDAQKGYASWHLVGTLDHRGMKEIHGWIFGQRFISLKFSAMFLVMVPLAKLRAASSPTKISQKKFPRNSSPRTLRSRRVCGSSNLCGFISSNPMKTLYPSKKCSVVLWTPNFGFVSLLKEGMRSIFFICRLGKTVFLVLVWWVIFSKSVKLVLIYPPWN